MVLIPKVKGASSISQFHPIALSNFMFKIIPKIISTWLSFIIGKLVMSNKCGFVKDMQISSCIG